ncbi:cobalamin biosynthesis protein [Pseudomonas chlororaphis]|uniref:cobalamin biosynthesis protein n=1 Tax=Pseudomonas chlororaphis TaxID=587753 RepID=UPI0006A611A2|nr:cobalamin biosynthesis protein [Pseudomonas chlororaphis]AZC31923.1 Cobalamin biosynthesis protein CobE [Pseudomonas chlororaphis subsp. piscium]AZC51429.1 Cobalamin biosynthesis protein CobE [Pseudomonas chlororaphis subsp. piscium]AZC58000.1 Cobalamin biosynthesis protein CobE [Pseudomonas chlororaphis subsp. piscium]AZC64239.1 Cobalamin biosynthesis protein CobE [Pseudomonas chlororaphis subsp. piscium]AZC70460.1 Cobalamin biosynthesis protein CobE [Pseudomonas chlororaphis subsp. pisciu
MTDSSTAPTLVVGLGCQRGCPVETLRALLDQTLSAHRIDLGQIKALASIDLKREEPGLLALAAQLGLPLTCFSSRQLTPYVLQLSHRSEIAYEHTGCYGVAESAALALAEYLAQGSAKLLVPRQKYAQATLALACCG